MNSINKNFTNEKCPDCGKWLSIKEVDNSICSRCYNEGIVPPRIYLCTTCTETCKQNPRFNVVHCPCYNEGGTSENFKNKN